MSTDGLTSDQSENNKPLGMQAISPKQSDQIGRIFALWALVSLCIFIIM
jgi:hypothetical protein